LQCCELLIKFALHSDRTAARTHAGYTVQSTWVAITSSLPMRYIKHTAMNEAAFRVCFITVGAPKCAPECLVKMHRDIITYFFYGFCCKTTCLLQTYTLNF
jgi:hypothetical protein